MSSIKTTYGLNNLGELVHIKQQGLARGLECNCTCACCGQRLVARIGEKRARHFAHYNGEEQLCQYALETELHIRAKHLIDQRREISLPLHFFRQGSKVVYQVFSIDNVRIEQFHLGKKPDLIVSIAGFEYLLEIAVTHFADKNKIIHLRKHSLSSAEFNLSSIRNELNVEAALERVLFSTNNDVDECYWLALNPLSPIGERALVEIRALAIQANEDIKKANNEYLDIQEKVKNGTRVNKQLNFECEALKRSLSEIRMSEEFLHWENYEREHNKRLEELYDFERNLNEKHRDIKRKTSEFTHYESRKKNELIQTEKDIKKRELEVESYKNRIKVREKRLTDLNEKLGHYGLSLDSITELVEILGWKEKIQTRLDLEGLSFKHLDKLVAALHSIDEIERRHLRRVEQLENSFSDMEARGQSFKKDISELLMQKDFYQKEIAKLHRELNILISSKT